MIPNRKKLIMFLTAVLLSACMQDKGNYDYTSINKIEITGINDYSEPYIVDQFAELEIVPGLDFSEGTEITDLSYEWKIEDQVVSNERNLKTDINLAPGTYKGNYVVINNGNELKYMVTFRITVQTPTTNALFILHELPDGTGVLSFQRRDRNDTQVVENAFEKANPDFGTLGIRPTKINTSPGGVISGDVTMFFTEGERKMVLLDRSTLELKSYFNEESIGAALPPGCVFEPYGAYIHWRLGGFILSLDGRAYLYDYWNSGQLYLPTPEELDIRFLAGDSRWDSYGFMVYERNSHSFGMLKESGPAEYNTFVPSTLGDTPQGVFITGGFPPAVSDTYTPGVVFLDGETAVFYNLNLDVDENPLTYEVKTDVIPEIVQTHNSLIDKDSFCTLCHDRYWYLATGRLITKLFNGGGDPPRQWFTLPESAGKVVDILMDDRQDKPRRLFVATYNGNESRIFVLDTENPDTETESSFGIEGRIVSLGRTGSGWI